MSDVTTKRGMLKDRRQKWAIFAIVGGGLGLLSLSFLPITGSASPAPTTITVSNNATWGPTLTLKNGDTLYRLSVDSKNHSRSPVGVRRLAAGSPGPRTESARGDWRERTWFIHPIERRPPGDPRRSTVVPLRGR